jgi:hypothetical protein
LTFAGSAEPARRRTSTSAKAARRPRVDLARVSSPSGTEARAEERERGGRRLQRREREEVAARFTRRSSPRFAAAARLPSRPAAITAAACPRAGRLPSRSYLRAYAPPRRCRAGPSAGFPFCRRRRRSRKEADLLEVTAPQSSRPPPRAKEASDLCRRWPGKEETQAQAAVPSSARPSAALPRRLFSSASRCTPLLPFTQRCGSVPISRTEDVRRRRPVHLVDSIWLQRERGRGRNAARWENPKNAAREGSSRKM